MCVLEVENGCLKIYKMNELHGLVMDGWMVKLIDKESGRLSLSSFLVKVDEKRRKYH